MPGRSLSATLALAVIGLAPFTAGASPILPNVWYEFSWDAGVTPLAACTAACILATNPPDGNPIVNAPDPAWTITLAGSGDLIVQDLFLSVDRFDFHDGATDLGNTSLNVSGSDCGASIIACMGNAAFSHGDFALAAGAHSFTGTQINAGSPGGAAVFEVRQVAATPEPASLALLGTGLLSLAGLGLRRRRKTG
jgi:hypothetical protein